MGEKRTYRPKDRYLNLTKHFEEEARNADYDKDTGIYNKSFMQKLGKLQESRRPEDWSPFGVAFIDVNNFKVSANDAYDHATGDTVLKLVASLLHKAVREYDVPCRWGGDEFVILLSDMSPDSITGEIEKQISEKLSKEYQIAISPLLSEKPKLAEISFSVGVSKSEMKDSFDHVVKQADSRMFMNKKAANKNR